MTGRAYMGKVLIKVELLYKQMNAQKESLKKLPESLKKLPFTSSRCAMKMKVEELELEEKNDGRLKYFLMEGRVYKARAENSCHGYQTTSGQRFFIH